MNRYLYEGPVMCFKTVVQKHWVAETDAVSKARARANLLFRYKKYTGRSLNSKLSLPGKIQTIRELIPDSQINMGL